MCQKTVPPLGQKVAPLRTGHRPLAEVGPGSCHSFPDVSDV